MKDLKISATPLNSQVCRFSFSENIFGDIESFVCDSKEKANGSLLLEEIFKIQDVTKVALNAQDIKVQFDKEVDWTLKAKEVGGIIRSCLKSDKEPLSPKVFQELSDKDKVPQSQTSSTAIEGIQKVIQEQINPGLAAHGGSVDIVDYKDHILFLSFKGGCQGCSQVTVTVRQGVERLLKGHFPELKKVEDVTDHEAGENPYFK